MKIKVHYVNHIAWGKDQDRTFDLGEMKFKSKETALDKMFEGFNNVIPEPREGEIGYYSMKHEVRSMSVMDMVEIDGETYVCCSLGWKKISNVDAYRKWTQEEQPISVIEKDLEKFV